MPLQRPEIRKQQQQRAAAAASGNDNGGGGGGGGGGGILKKSTKPPEAATGLPMDFSDYESGSDADILKDDEDNKDDDNSSTSSYTVGGTKKTGSLLKTYAQKIKSAIDKRLHLELFGITWFDFAAISCARWFFLLTLMGAAAGLAISVYIRLRSEEVQDFETDFDDLANEILDLSNEKALSVFKIMAGVATAITSSIGEKSLNSQFPRSFHTMPDMEQHFGTARNASGALVLAYSPLVQSNQLDEWAVYSASNQGWIDNINQAVREDYNSSDPILPFVWDYPSDNEEYADLKKCKFGLGIANDNDDAADETTTTSNPTTNNNNNRRRSLQETTEDDPRIPLQPKDGPFSPLWTYSPGPLTDDTTNINHDLFAKPNMEQALNSVISARQPMFLDVCNLAIWFLTGSEIQDQATTGTTTLEDIDTEVEVQEELEAVIGYPVYASFQDNAPVLGTMIEIFTWRVFFERILADAQKPVLLVLESSCGQVATFRIQGPEATLIAEEDTHDSTYNDLAVSAAFAAFANPPELIQQDDIQGVCSFNMTIYPTSQMEEQYLSTQPLWFAMIVVCVFFATSVLFFLFDRLMTRQRNNIMNTAKKQNIIVSSLFPKSVQAKMLEQVDLDHNNLSKIGKAGLRQYIEDEEGGGADRHKDGTGHDPHGGTAGLHRTVGIADKSKPIADLFPHTTIMFGDIAGFTAWSSARDPSQVFVLLETIYHEFDAIAKRRRVFKVEVIGDCYVAVCGLPDPRPDHAVVMAKFASECIHEMNRLCQDLEVELGPDTTELGFRVGLHSGPVVAGVLRGEKSRFQLFGDTMNTAARMESTGIPNRVQISESTAELLEQVNKAHWYELREDKVQAKGKGELTTYLLKIHRDNKLATQHSSGYMTESDTQSVASSLNSDAKYRDELLINEKRNRIADWTVEVLADLLQEIEVRRRASQIRNEASHRLMQMEQNSVYTGERTVIDDVKEIVELPEYNVTIAQRESKMDAGSIQLGEDVMTELRTFVRTIASMYHDNPFHNFPHANHVTMSVVKLLGRIKAPDVSDVKTTLHDYTYGITSDPLTRFAVVFSALIHDVDHMGVSNMQLVKEKDPLAKLYRDKSVAEQNSIDIAWDLLMEPRFDNLRQQIYTTEAEFKRFRQLVINTVLATDIMDKDLKELRNKRWDKAFSEHNDNSTRQNINRKATIVIEHLIQASDVAHTMQHWHIYRKWNERLFQELYRAWEHGRLDNDPSLSWYKGELGFFDFYIIPLAKKLKECGVFGVSSDEYLSYALQNRKEWEARGEELIQEMLKNISRKRVAQSVFDTSRFNVDQEGTEIVAEMSRSLRRASQMQQAEHGKFPESVTIHPSSEGSSVNDSSEREGGRGHPDDDESIDDSSVDSEFETELEMKLKPM